MSARPEGEYHVIVQDHGSGVQVHFYQWEVVAGIKVMKKMPETINLVFGREEDRRQVLKDALVHMIENL